MRFFLLLPVLVLCVSCGSKSGLGGLGPAGAASKQAGGNQHVVVSPGTAYTPGEAIEKFHRGAMKNQPAGTYRYPVLRPALNNHARASNHGGMVSYGFDPASAVAAVGMNLARLSQNKPSTYSLSEFTKTQRPLSVPKGTRVSVKVERVPEAIEAITPAGLTAIRRAVTDALKAQGYVPSSRGGVVLTVRPLRAAERGKWVSGELIARWKGRVVKGFFVGAGQPKKPAAPGAVEAIGQTISGMFSRPSLVANALISN